MAGKWPTGSLEVDEVDVHDEVDEVDEAVED